MSSIGIIEMTTSTGGTLSTATIATRCQPLRGTVTTATLQTHAKQH
jgi:hypothetical protein